jgi:glycosyltransferase involved in cell wall biosynthesis
VTPIVEAAPRGAGLAHHDDTSETSLQNESEPSTDKLPIASIVITTRDRNHLAPQAVNSALAQTVGDIEVIVVDDGSIEPFRPPNEDERLRVLRLESSSGLCAARNLGLRSARGQWVTFLDDDDELLPHMLEVSLRGAAESTLPPPVAVLSGFEVVDADGNLIEIRLPARLPGDEHYSQHVQNSFFAPREVLEAIGGWDDALPPWEHVDLFIRVSEICSIQGVREVTYRLVSHPGPRLTQNHLFCAVSMSRTLQKHRRWFDRRPRRRSRFLAEMSRQYLDAGRWWPAFSAATRSFLAEPRRRGALRQWARGVAGPYPLGLFRRLRSRSKKSTTTSGDESLQSRAMPLPPERTFE